MREPLTFLFVPIDAVGHVNACIGVGQELLLKGHKVVFAISSGWIGKLEPLGFVERCYQVEPKEDLSVEKWGELVRTMAPALAMPPLLKLEHFHTSIYQNLIVNAKEADARLHEIVREVEPDLALIDAIHNPAICDFGIPWMIFLSINPMGITVGDMPPAFSGYSVYDGDRELWDSYRKRAREVYEPLYQDFRQWIMDVGGVEINYDDRCIWTNQSPYGNLYMFPEEMSYTIDRPDPPNWHRFDTFARHEPEPFEVPEKLATRPGKLVYVSLGTIGCSDLDLMRKLITICAKSPHRFIISKGRLGDQLELAENMWGANNLPQTNILPLVDLVITHGGNNTITESFYFGNRVLVLPLFVDQIDNGTRVEETGLGLQFDPYRVTEEELLKGIETLLGDKLLEGRMKAISRRIKASKSQLRAAELLENVALNNAPIMCTRL